MDLNGLITLIFIRNTFIQFYALTNAGLLRHITAYVTLPKIYYRFAY